MTGELLCIIPGPTKVLRTRDDGTRWCFRCRAHLPHQEVLLGDDYDPEDINTYSYYDPVWVRQCSRCGEDRTTFPGRA